MDTCKDCGHPMDSCYCNCECCMGEGYNEMVAQHKERMRVKTNGKDMVNDIVSAAMDRGIR